jgi:hypothetical protein
MISDNRIASRHAFETRIQVRLCRDNQNRTVTGWARDLSEGGLGAFVAEELILGELVVLLVPLAQSSKEEFAACVTRQVGTQYGFQFTALSAEQRQAIRSAMKRQPVVS